MKAHQKLMKAGDEKGAREADGMPQKMAELELELVQYHMTQKPVLRGEVDARALRV